MTLAIVDAGPLIASFDAADPIHDPSIEALRRRDLRPVIPAMVVAEVSYIVGRRFGPPAEAEFLASLVHADVELPTTDDWIRISELVRQYADFPLGGAEASIVALAERVDTSVIITMDHRHFGAVRPRHVDAFELLP